MTYYYNFVFIIWIFWISLKIFVWLYLLDIGYDKYFLIYFKICCRFIRVKKKKKVKWLCIENILNYMVFVKINFSLGNL